MSLQHLWPDIKVEIIQAELEELARDFDADPDQRWTGSEVADYLRDRAKNHPALTNGMRETP
jgi:hypothetical protein